MSITALSTASAGMQIASSRLDEASARAAASDGDFVNETAELRASKVQMQASIAVARTADQMMGTLLDMMI